MRKKGIEADLTKYERLRRDGNTRISIMETQNKTYIIKYDTS